jgi:hypothetical protein
MWFSIGAKITSQMLHECKVTCLWAEQTKGHEKGSKLSALQMKAKYSSVWSSRACPNFNSLQVLEKVGGGGGAGGLSVVSLVGSIIFFLAIV